MCGCCLKLPWPLPFYTYSGNFNLRQLGFFTLYLPSSIQDYHQNFYIFKMISFFMNNIVYGTIHNKKTRFPLGLNFTFFFFEGLPIYMFSPFMKFWTIFGVFWRVLELFLCREVISALKNGQKMKIVFFAFLGIKTWFFGSRKVPKEA